MLLTLPTAEMAADLIRRLWPDGAPVVWASTGGRGVIRVGFRGHIKLLWTEDEARRFVQNVRAMREAGYD